MKPTAPRTEPRADIYSRVTAKIIADLEQGARPWSMRWNAGQAGGQSSRPLRANGEPYRGINVLLLWSEAADKQYRSAHWMTYKQAAELGGQVRKGEQGCLIVFANRLTKTETDDDGVELEREIPVMRGYTVFNVDQIDGLPARFHPVTEESVTPLPRIEAAEAFFAATGADIRHGGAHAFYSPSTDRVQMPPRESFRDAQAYAATVAHELTHWTAHPSRLARELGKRFGDQAYAAEELIAEIGSAFLCADLGISPTVREDHASYVASWLQVLKDDSRAIFTAASSAQRAADFLHSFQAS